MVNNDFLFTSESVSEGHPDKVADQISDAILDAIFEQDPQARVAAETLCNTGLVVLAGEITTHANVDYIQVARDTIKRIGYDNGDYGIDYKSCAVLVAYDKQSPDIAQGVDRSPEELLNQGAGDQGLMFGYACDETPDLMPAPIWYAHRLVQRQSELRKDGRLAWLRPDAKSQVTFRYVDGRPTEVDTVVLSTQHAPEMSQKDIHEAVIEHIIRPCFPSDLLTEKTRFLVNPTGKFVIGGPQGDCGLTGRKIIVDTYGGACPHGGGAFSGKDPFQSRPLCGLRSPLRGQEHCGCGSGASVSGAVELRHWCGRAYQYHHLHRRHRRDLGYRNRQTGASAFRSAPTWHYRHAGPAAPHLHQDGSLRSLRS